MSEQEYNDCVNLYADNVYRFIVKNLQHQEDARDIVQTAFEKLWRNKNRVEHEKAKSYLFTIAYNQMIDHIRSKKTVLKNKDTLIYHKETKVYQPPVQLKKNLQEAFEQLTEIQKSLVMLKDYEGYSYAEIGEIMDLNENQVKVYLHRARLILKKYLVKAENLI